jgi:phosphoribosyl-ATP pyrophosphohydrolase/phosphoribosyl-AMP cyclohydrolase
MTREITVDRQANLVESTDWSKSDGLIPAIVQHVHDGRVLMLGYVDRVSLEATVSTGLMHFHSRSRNALWRKGEMSGNVLKVVSIAMDCDRDALLCQVVPAGPTCHRGTNSCFDGEARAHPWLNELEALIAERLKSPAEGSYVATLVKQGLPRVAQKVGEEGVETAIAAISGDEEALSGEAADLLFHLLVLLHARGLAIADVIKVLADRHRAE